jgi:protein-tyrosine-phosphatase
MKSYNILFLCTHNSARSIIGEALASTHPSGKFKGFSAGSTPGTSVNPIAADIATELGMDHTLLKSKSWDVYGQPDAPKMDFIITVCDNAAGEQCPFWPGQPATAHWGFPDPSTLGGTREEKLVEIRKIRDLIRARVEEWCAEGGFEGAGVEK